MHTCIHVVRVVSLSDDAYEALKRLKEPDHSFSDIVLMLAEQERRRRLEGVLGSWKMSGPEYDDFMTDVYERRRRSKPRRPSA